MKFYTALFVSLFALQTLWAQEVMTPEKLWKLGRVGLEAVSQKGDAFIFGVTRYDIDKNKGARDLYLYHLDDNKVVQITDMKGSEYGAQFLQNDQKIGFSNNGRFYLMDIATQKHEVISQEQESWGNIKAYTMADNKLLLLFTKPVKLDPTTEDLYPELDQANVKIIDNLMYRHWDHWSDAEYNHLHYAYFDLSKNEISTPVDIMEGERSNTPVEPFGGSESFTLNVKGSKIIYESKKMTGKDWAVSTNSDLYEYDLTTQKTTNITASNKGYDKSPQVSPDGSRLAYVSMKTDGYESDVNDLVIIDLTSGERTRLLQKTGHYDDLTISGFQWADDNTIYVGVPKDGVNQIYKVNLPAVGKSSEKYSIELFAKGQWNYNHFEIAAQQIIVSRQDMNHASEIYSIGLKKGKVQQLTHVNDDLYNNIDLSKIEKRMIKTSDGKDMLTWVIYPPDFDPNKKYPTLLYCQGGPQSQVSQFYSFRWNFQLMAAQGYIVVAPNRRGLPGFGRVWNEQISEDWGGQAMKDYLAAIDEVSKEDFVDKENLGCVGASYGGYSVYYLAGNHEKRFSAFISHCGLFDLENWYLTTEEIFFANQDIGGPFWEEENKAGYQKHDPKNYIQNWDTPILVIHGGHDFRVPEAQGMAAFQAAQLQGVPSKFVYFPEEGHWILSPQNGLIWHDQFFGWLDQWLKD